ncbi:MAG TPA: GGDEF domain-containing protein [Arthrobacter sp.]|nr:GGDEF domain-containing protein [Arthrobacter sp.]
MAAAVITFAVLCKEPPAHAIGEGLIPAAIAVAAWKAPLPYRVRSVMAAVGLMVIAAATVHISGTVEAHFLFFIMVPVVALYEDWAPVAAAIGTVLIHHIALGILAPQYLSGHPGKADEAAGWVMVHIALFLASCITSVMHWTIHERARAEERILLDRLAALAQHDPLTGLANRSLLHERLKAAVSADESTLVIAVDIDGFKPVNDSHGHAAGDAMLVEIARRLTTCLRTGDTAARTGGDEFTLVLPGSSAEQGATMAQRILDAIAAPYAVEGKHLNVSASIGISVGPLHADPRVLLEQADAAMYSAKLSGRATFASYGDAADYASGRALIIDAENARIWAAYTRDLRHEISKAKDSGTLPTQTRGPESTRRTLESLLAAIDNLPQKPGLTPLSLPDVTAMEEFVFHHDLVQKWATTLNAKRILDLDWADGAATFWNQLTQAVISGNSAKPGPRINGPRAQNPRRPSHAGPERSDSRTRAQSKNRRSKALNEFSSKGSEETDDDHTVEPR